MAVDNLMQWFESWTLWEAGSSLPFLIAVLITGIPIFLLMAVNALVAVYAELKISAFMQDRLGPMGQGPGLHAGKWGLLQTVADALKLLLKEDIIPTLADRKLFIILPFNQDLLIADLNIGVFYILAVGSIGVIGIIMAGWSSNNKWSLYGAMRSAAQIISYEIPVALSIVSVIMLTGTLSMQGIISYQSGTTLGILPNWILFNNPFSFIAFFIFFISGVAAVAFLGGWHSPIPGFMESSGWGLFWFISKVGGLIFIMMWFRWTFPRLRVDQLMNICWKVLLPLALLNIFGVGIWTLLTG